MSLKKKVFKKFGVKKRYYTLLRMENLNWARWKFVAHTSTGIGKWKVEQ